MRAVNLIPSEQRAGGGSAAGESQGAAYIVLAVLGGLAVLAGLYGIASHQVSSRETEVAKVNAEAQAAQAQAQALAPYTSFKATYEQRRDAVSQLVNTRFDWAHAFHELGRVLPSDASLSSVKGTIAASASPTGAGPGPGAGPSTSAGTSTASTGTASAGAGAGAQSAGASVTSATPPGSIPTFAIAGCATSQSEVAQTLLRLRLIDGVSGVTLQSSTKTTTGGASSGGGGSSGCPSGDAAFTATVAFQALPAPTTPAAGSTTPAANTTSGTGGAQ